MILEKKKNRLIKETFENKQISLNKTIKSVDLNKTIKSVDLNKTIKLTSDNYSEIYYVLQSLLDNKYLKKNKENIDKLIQEFDIYNIFDISDKILSETKTYNNFLEKITCIKNGNLSNIDYISSCEDNINYKKIKAFSELIRVYTLSIEKVIELINKHEIYKLCDMVSNKEILDNYNNHTSYGYEYLGLLYYTNKKKINDKYYKILELLELDKLLDSSDSNLTLKNRIYNYSNKNKRIVKDLNSIIVLFDYYQVFNKQRLEYDEDDYEWDYSILKNIDLNKVYWEHNPFFIKYKLKDKIIETLNKFTIDINIFKHKINELDNNKPNTSQKQHYKVIKNDTIENPELMDKLTLNYIKNNFSLVFIEIIKDFTNLYQIRCKSNCNTDKPLSIFLYYFNGMIQIIIKKGRMFYVGIFIILLSIMLYFVQLSS